MATFFAISGILLLVASVTANVTGRALGWMVPLWFLTSAIATEAAVVLLILEWGLLVFATCFLDLDNGKVMLGVVALVASLFLTARALMRHFDAGALFERALATGLGPDFRAVIPPVRRHRLRQQITSDDWLRPLGFSKPGVEVVRDVAYGPAGKRNTLDIYRRRVGDEPRPVLLQIHGGAWLVGHKGEQALPLLNHMASLGWVCVSINYRLAPKATFPDPIIDVKRAIAWVRENIADWGGDPNYIAVTGGSAGGHLAALAALSPNHAPWQPGFESADTSLQAAMPLYGVYDLCDRTGIRHGTRIDEYILQRLMKTDANRDPALFDAASPITWLTPDAPPFFVVQGQSDTLVWVEEARRFVADYASATKQPLVYAELPGTQHAFDTILSPRTAHFLNAAAQWLEWGYADWQGRRED